MAIHIDPDVREARTQAEPQRSGGWFTRVQRFVKLALGGDEEELLVQNDTEVPWLLYHNFHQLGLIEPHERQTLMLLKRGSLSARPPLGKDAVEYLVLPLNGSVQHARIYRKHIGELEVYEMRSTG